MPGVRGGVLVWGAFSDGRNLGRGPCGYAWSHARSFEVYPGPVLGAVTTFVNCWRKVPMFPFLCMFTNGRLVRFKGPGCYSKGEILLASNDIHHPRILHQAYMCSKQPGSPAKTVCAHTRKKLLHTSVLTR